MKNKEPVLPSDLQDVLRRYSFEISVTGMGLDPDDYEVDPELLDRFIPPTEDDLGCADSCCSCDCSKEDSGDDPEGEGTCAGCPDCEADGIEYPQIVYTAMVTHQDSDDVLLIQNVSFPIDSSESLHLYTDESEFTEDIMLDLVKTTAKQILRMENAMGKPLPKLKKGLSFENAAEA